MTRLFIVKQITTLLSILFISLMGVACSGKTLKGYFEGKARPENRFALKVDGPHAAIWRTPDLGIHYRYTLKGKRFEMEGHVVRQHRTKHFPHLTAWIRIHFLDESGLILESRRLWSQRGSDVYWTIRWQFNRGWDLPPGTRAIGFSYSGSAGDKDVSWEFWKTP